MMYTKHDGAHFQQQSNSMKMASFTLRRKKKSSPSSFSPYPIYLGSTLLVLVFHSTLLHPCFHQLAQYNPLSFLVTSAKVFTCVPLLPIPWMCNLSKCLIGADSDLLCTCLYPLKRHYHAFLFY